MKLTKHFTIACILSHQVQHTFSLHHLPKKKKYNKRFIFMTNWTDEYNRVATNK